MSSLNQILIDHLIEQFNKLLQQAGLSQLQGAAKEKAIDEYRALIESDLAGKPPTVGVLIDIAAWRDEVATPFPPEYVGPGFSEREAAAKWLATGGQTMVPDVQRHPDSIGLWITRSTNGEFEVSAFNAGTQWWADVRSEARYLRSLGVITTEGREIQELSFAARSFRDRVRRDLEGVKDLELRNRLAELSAEHAKLEAARAQAIRQYREAEREARLSQSLAVVGGIIGIAGTVASSLQSAAAKSATQLNESYLKAEKASLDVYVTEEGVRLIYDYSAIESGKPPQLYKLAPSFPQIQLPPKIDLTTPGPG